MVRGTDISYTVEETNILLFRRANTSQERSVEGFGPHGRCLRTAWIIGASVIVRGTTLGVSTDVEGRFMLEVPAPAASRDASR